MKNIKKNIFDQQVVDFSKKNRNKELLERHKKILNLIYKHSVSSDSILDIGCFDGKILKALEKEGYKNLYGVDFSETSKSSFKDTNIHFKTYDIENDSLPFNNKFDVIVYTDVLEHLLSPQATLFDIRKHLSKNGKIIFSVPNAGFFLNGLLLSFLPSKLFLSSAFGPWGHTYHFTFYQVKKISESLGFDLVGISGGWMKNYIFKSGIKKLFYDIFIFTVSMLSLIFPKIFSDHIFGVLENSSRKPKGEVRYEAEV